MGGGAGGVVGGIAGGVILGLAFAPTLNLQVYPAFHSLFSASLGLAGGLAFLVYYGLSNLGTVGVAIGIAGAAATIFAGFCIGLFVAFVEGIPIPGVRRSQVAAWFRGLPLFVLLSALFSHDLARLNEWLTGEAVPIITLMAIFILAYTRIPIWPVEALWGVLLCWRHLNSEAGGGSDTAALAKTIRCAYFDRQMILPLPGEVAALQRLAAVDENLAITEWVDVASRSNHWLAAISILRSLASSNPMEVETALREDSDMLFPEMIFRYLPGRVSEMAVRVWAASQRLHALSSRLNPAGSKSCGPFPVSAPR
jgi:hypothetical protein